MKYHSRTCIDPQGHLKLAYYLILCCEHAKCEYLTVTSTLYFWTHKGEGITIDLSRNQAMLEKALSLVVDVDVKTVTIPIQQCTLTGKVL